MYVFFSLVACYQAFVILVYFVTFYVLDSKLKLAFFKDTSYIYCQILTSGQQYINYSN